MQAVEKPFVPLSNRIKIAYIQLNSGVDIVENINAATVLIEKAVREGATLLALPENAFYFDAPGERHRPRYATNDEHPGVHAMQALCKKHGIWILIGSVALAAPEDKWFNRSLLLNPAGEVAAAYDKLHLFDVTLPNGEIYAESKRITPGNQAVLASTPWGGLGMSVCYDVRFPQLYRALAQAGAVLLTVPAAFTAVTGAAHWHTLLRARAIETGCFVLAAATVGSHPGGRQTYGHSLIINPWGEILAEGSADAPDYGVVEIDLSEVAKARARIPSLSHDRAFTLALPPPVSN